MFIKHLNSGILFVNTTPVRVLTDVLVVLHITARYAAYRKLSILVKHYLSSCYMESTALKEWF